MRTTSMQDREEEVNHALKNNDLYEDHRRGLGRSKDDDYKGEDGRETNECGKWLFELLD